MSYRVLLTPQAEEQLHDGDAWWQENRRAAPDLLVEEFEHVVELLREMPSIGSPFRRATAIESHAGSFRPHDYEPKASSLG